MQNGFVESFNGRMRDELGQNPLARTYAPKTVVFEPITLPARFLVFSRLKNQVQKLLRFEPFLIPCRYDYRIRTCFD